MNSRSTPPGSKSAVEDFVFDEDAPRGFATANDNGRDGPAWVWVLVRVSGDERQQQVWVRYKTELAPLGLYTKAASPPKDGDDGVLVLPRRRVAAVVSSNGPARTLVPFLAHVRAVAAARNEILRAIAKALEQNDHQAIVRHAKALVGG